jgi:hypothetical protein
MVGHDACVRHRERRSAFADYVHAFGWPEVGKRHERTFEYGRLFGG